MLPISSIITILGSVALANAQLTCGGSGTFEVEDIHANLGTQTLGPRSARTIVQGSGQICIVNRAPSATVVVADFLVNNAIGALLNFCCPEQTCSGGQDKITAASGNVVDLSVQALGQDCSA
ncbi:hypothetical protein F5Y13DRAFT_186702 [Hypoxylon sp. FL1857]|nr:hypothetical protein F5Y13DRAFT_186702 [Hypoxylon sp. FL1857]